MPTLGQAVQHAASHAFGSKRGNRTDNPSWTAPDFTAKYASGTLIKTHDCLCDHLPINGPKNMNIGCSGRGNDGGAQERNRS